MSNSIISTGSYTTDDILDNEMLSEMVDTNDEWIVSRTGIKTRHIAKDKTTEELAYESSIRAIEKSGIDPSEIGVLVFATVTSDTRVPSSAFRLAGMLGIDDAICFDVNAACSGFIYSTTIADSLLKTSDKRYALVVGSERLTKIVNFTDRSTCVLFGDGSGCAIIAKDEAIKNKCGHLIQEGDLSASDSGLKSEATDSISLNMLDSGSQKEVTNSISLNMLDSGSRNEAIDRISLNIVDSIIGGSYDKNGYLSAGARKTTDEEVNEYISMNGRRVYKFATETGSEVINKLLERNSLNGDDISMVVPHQANIRIIQTMAEKSRIDVDKWYTNVSEYGNTSSASVPMAFDEALEENSKNLKSGDYVVLVAFGGGLSYGAMLLKVN